MALTELTLLGTTVFGVPSGNYDGSSTYFEGDAVKGVNYYQGQGSIQTVTMRMTDFTGIITVKASLNDDPDQAAWVDVYEFGDTSTITPGTITVPAAIIGNYVWLKVAVTGFDSGTIVGVTVAY